MRFAHIIPIVGIVLTLVILVVAANWEAPASSVMQEIAELDKRIEDLRAQEVLSHHEGGAEVKLEIDALLTKRNELVRESGTGPRSSDHAASSLPGGVLVWAIALTAWIGLSVFGCVLVYRNAVLSDGAKAIIALCFLLGSPVLGFVLYAIVAGGRSGKEAGQRRSVRRSRPAESAPERPRHGPPKPERTQADRHRYSSHRLQASEDRECPFCAEIIKRKAKICRYCKSDLT